MCRGYDAEGGKDEFSQVANQVLIEVGDRGHRGVVAMAVSSRPSNYPWTPGPVSVFIVELDPRVGGNSFQYPFLVVGISPTEVLPPRVTITVYGYGMGAAQAENAAGGVSSSSAIFAEGYILGS